MSHDANDIRAATPGSFTWTGDGTVSGDTLTVPAFGTASVSTTGDADLNLVEQPPGAHVTIDVAPGSRLTLNAQVTSGILNASGGTIRFIGSNSFSGFSTVLDDNIRGTATLNLNGQNANGELMEINGSVGSGLTFHLAGTAPDASLQIDKPSQFFGQIELTSAPVGVGHVAFEGIHATSADLFGGILAMFDNNRLVDVARVSGRTDLQLHQIASGVILTAGSFSDIAPSNLGTAIPLHQLA
jgi:hypothetical protein